METSRFEVLIGKINIYKWVNCVFVMVKWDIKLILFGGVGNTIREGHVVTRSIY
jgi:hypothetical protein